MPLFSYNNDIPDAPNNPSNDQPKMKVNTNSIDSIIDVDHYSFETNSDGWHKQVTLPQLGAAPTTVVGQLALYSKAVNPLGSTGLFMIRQGVAGTEVQLTSAKITAPVALTNGYTFLPGDILIQWGSTAISAAGSFTTVLFATSNVNFPNNCFNVVLTMINNQGASPSANSVFVKSGSVSTTGFQITNTSSSATQSAYWVAIGN